MPFGQTQPQLDIGSLGIADQKSPEVNGRDVSTPLTVASALPSNAAKSGPTGAEGVDEDGAFISSQEVPMIGFDHPHGSAHVPAGKTPSSRRVKAAAARTRTFHWRRLK